MGLIRGMARTAVAAGTTTAVSNRVSPPFQPPPEKLAVNRRNA